MGRLTDSPAQIGLPLAVDRRARYGNERAANAFAAQIIQGGLFLRLWRDKNWELVDSGFPLWKHFLKTYKEA